MREKIIIKKLPKYFKQKNVYKIGWIGLILAVLISVFVRVPFGFFDEQVHYFRAIGISRGQLLSYSKGVDKNNLGHDIKISQLEFEDQYIVQKTDIISTRWVSSKAHYTETDKTQYVLSTSAAPYTPVAYTPLAVVSLVSRVADISVKNEFILMRLFGAISSLTLVFFAFKVSPKKHRWTILAIAMLPMSIASFAAVSIDGFTIASTLLFMAIITRVVINIRVKKLTDKDILILLAASLLVVFAKMPAFLMVSLILGIIILFWKKISKQHKIYMFAIIGVSALITLSWAYYAKDINTGAYWGRNVSTVEQLKFIVGHPLAYFRNLLFAVLNYDYPAITYLNYADKSQFMKIPLVLSILILLGIVLSSSVNIDKQKSTINVVRFYWLQVVLYWVIACSIFTLLYLQFTPIGTLNTIEGVQPRYFVPFLALLAMYPYSLKLSKNWRKFALMAPFIGVVTYLGIIAIQL